MTERPILFSAPMVRAILDGSKTQTRRVVKGQAPAWSTLTDEEDVEGRDFFVVCGEKESNGMRPILASVHCPYGQPGDRLWVRETWCSADILFQGYECDPPQVIGYRADLSARIDGDNPIGTHGWNWEHESVRWKPSIHMPRWASRITLGITGVRVERLQDISEADALAEGARYHDGRGIGHSGWRHDNGDVHADARSAYARLWNDINGAGSWDANPWVWVVEFKRITRAAAAIGEKMP